MSLIKDFEIQDTGLVVPNAYHIITHVEVEKRLKDSEATTFGRQYAGPRNAGDTSWLAGYYARIVISVWKDEASRAEGKLPLGVINASYGVPDMFRLDETSTDSYLVQAYNYLKTVPYYSDAVLA